MIFFPWVGLKDEELEGERKKGREKERERERESEREREREEKGRENQIMRVWSLIKTIRSWSLALCLCEG